MEKNNDEKKRKQTISKILAKGFTGPFAPSNFEYELNTQQGHFQGILIASIPLKTLKAPERVGSTGTINLSMKDKHLSQNTNLHPGVSQGNSFSDLLVPIQMQQTLS